WLGEPHLFVEQALGAVNKLARFETLNQVADLGFKGDDLGVAGESNLNRRQKVVGGERLDHVGQCAGLGGAFDEPFLAESREKHNGSDVVLAELLSRRDAVEQRHLDVHYDEVRAQLGCQRYRGFSVTRLSDDIETVVTERLDDVESDERLVFGYDDAA